MIKLHTWKTPNGRKISILLEELGLHYEVVPVDFGRNEQFAPSFLAISPNNKIPAIVDDEAKGGELAIFESGAIMTYLADKAGKLLPKPIRPRMEVLSWVYWQVGGLAPMLGQLGFFSRSDEKAPLAIDRFTKEADRLLRVLDTRLASRPFVGGEDYSIADIACYPWALAATTMLATPLADTLAAIPHVQAWLETVGARPAVQRGMAIPS